MRFCFATFARVLCFHKQETIRQDKFVRTLMQTINGTCGIEINQSNASRYLSCEYQISVHDVKNANELIENGN